jgi:hypothetical protein
LVKTVSHAGHAPVSRGTFRKKRAPKKFPPEMLVTGEGGDELKKFSGHTIIFSEYNYIFLDMSLFFSENNKIFPDIPKY